MVTPKSFPTGNLPRSLRQRRKGDSHTFGAGFWCCLESHSASEQTQNYRFSKILASQVTSPNLGTQSWVPQRLSCVKTLSLQLKKAGAPELHRRYHRIWGPQQVGMSFHSDPQVEEGVGTPSPCQAFWGRNLGSHFQSYHDLCFFENLWTGDGRRPLLTILKSKLRFQFQTWASSKTAKYQVPA